MAEHKDGVLYLSTLDLIKKFFNRNKFQGEKSQIESNAVPPAPQNTVINSIAVILDGQVQEVLRAENRLAALLLSQPEFIEFDPQEVRPEIGWFYEDGTFINEFGDAV